MGEKEKKGGGLKQKIEFIHFSIVGEKEKKGGGLKQKIEFIHFSIVMTGKILNVVYF